MHIPDGYLDTQVATASAVLAAGGVGYAAVRAREALDRPRVVRAAAAGAAVFALQMLNAPVTGGTSGHMIGAALAVALCGVWLGTVVMAVVLTTQALLFADGGITALGGGVLAMAVVACLVAGACIEGARRARPGSRPAFLAGVAAGAWLSVIAASTVVCVLLALSHTIPLGVSLPAMTGAHVLVGLGEAAVTVAIVAAVLALEPGREWAVSLVAVGASVLVAGLLAPLASALPDRLDDVAVGYGVPPVDPHAVADAAPIPDYAWPGVADASLATGLAGVAGTLVLAGAAALVAAALMRRRPVHRA